MPEPRHAAREEPGVRSRRVLALVFGFLGFTILLGGGLNVYYRAITRDSKLATQLQPFPSPQLQPSPTRDWEQFRIAQAASLEGYDWVDKARGVAHVPIADAMARVAARGAAGYDPVPGTPPFPPPGGAPLDGAPRAIPRPMAAPYGHGP